MYCWKTHNLGGVINTFDRLTCRKEEILPLIFVMLNNSAIKIYTLKCKIQKMYCGWLNFRGVPIFLVVLEGSIHEFQYPRNRDILNELSRKILCQGILNPANM